MKLYNSLPADLAAWAQSQPIFFTASAGRRAPHINVSPKGLTSTHFAVLSPTQCAYIDRTGSGCETIAHAYENARLTLLFISFGASPRILRLFCRASVIEYDDARFPPLLERVGAHTRFDGARAVILLHVWQVQTSCGYGVPRVKVKEGDETDVFEERPTLDRWAEKKVESNSMREYQNANNVESIDGLPGLRASRRDVGQWLWMGDVRAWCVRVGAEREALAVGFGVAAVWFVVLRVLGVL